MAANFAEISRAGKLEADAVSDTDLHLFSQSCLPEYIGQILYLDVI